MVVVINDLNNNQLKIEHHIARYYLGDESHSTPKWNVLSDALIQNIKKKEPPYPKPSDESWGCLRCGNNNVQLVTKPAALTHLKKT